MRKALAWGLTQPLKVIWSRLILGQWSQLSLCFLICRVGFIVSQTGIIMKCSEIISVMLLIRCLSNG